MQCEEGIQHVRQSLIVRRAAEYIYDLYIRASIPSFHYETIVSKPINFVADVAIISKSRMNTTYTESRFEALGFDKFLNFAACECNDLSNCTCSKDKNIPPPEIQLFKDNSTLKRKISIGSLDFKVTSQLAKRQRRNCIKIEDTEKFNLHKTMNLDGLLTNDEDAECVVEISNITSRIGDDWSLNETIPLKQNRYNVTNLALIADRCGVGSATAAMFVNAYHEDLGIAKSSNILDKKKIQRARQRERHRLSNEAKLAFKCKALSAIYFNSRCDNTLYKESETSEVFTQIHNHSRKQKIITCYCCI